VRACRLRCRHWSGSDSAQLSRMVRRVGLLRRPVYYSLKICLNLLLLATAPRAGAYW
jgi:hypothetical protein